MSIKVLDSSENTVELNEFQSNMLIDAINSGKDPRISGCSKCNSCVVACEPFLNVLDELSTTFVGEIDVIRELMDLVENSPTVHIYIWEENECVHLLWRDPVAFEWSGVTGEKRLHH